jgi:hypothetical protein
LVPPTKAATAMDDRRTGASGVQRRTIGDARIFVQRVLRLTGCLRAAAGIVVCASQGD